MGYRSFTESALCQASSSYLAVNKICIINVLLFSPDSVDAGGAFSEPVRFLEVLFLRKLTLTSDTTLAKPNR